MYSENYRKRSSKIDHGLNLQFIENARKSLKEINCGDRIALHFAIMEVETWFLGMPSVLKKINDSFFIGEADPEIVHFHPTKVLRSLFPENGYTKSKDQVEKICSYITSEDLDKLSKSKKCQSFNHFYEELKMDFQLSEEISEA